MWSCCADEGDEGDEAILGFWIFLAGTVSHAPTVEKAMALAVVFSCFGEKRIHGNSSLGPKIEFLVAPTFYSLKKHGGKQKDECRWLRVL
jgi:hypothetical protein